MTGVQWPRLRRPRWREACAEAVREGALQDYGGIVGDAGGKAGGEAGDVDGAPRRLVAAVAPIAGGPPVECAYGRGVLAQRGEARLRARIAGGLDLGEIGECGPMWLSAVISKKPACRAGRPRL